MCLGSTNLQQDQQIRAQAVSPNAETGSTDWSPWRPTVLVLALAATQGNPASTVTDMARMDRASM